MSGAATKLFCRRNLVWLRLSTPTSAKMGFTRAGVEQLGTVSNARQCVKVGADVKPGTPLISLFWEGYTRSAADELYHAVWESIEGATELKSPICCTLTRVNDLAVLLEAQGPLNDEDVWLCEVEFDEHALSGSKSLVDESSYQKWENDLREGRNRGPFLGTDLNAGSY